MCHQPVHVASPLLHNVLYEMQADEFVLRVWCYKHRTTFKVILRCVCLISSQALQRPVPLPMCYHICWWAVIGFSLVGETCKRKIKLIACTCCMRSATQFDVRIRGLFALMCSRFVVQLRQYCSNACQGLCKALVV